MNESYKYKTSELEASLSTFEEKGVTEFTLQDQTILGHKGKLLSFLKSFSQKCPQVLLTLPVDPQVLDMDICKAVAGLYCTLEIPLKGISKDRNYLFDKKFYNRRAQMLNTMGLLFGFSMDFCTQAGDGVRLFMERLDFALSLYPNHLDFPQLDRCPDSVKSTSAYSTQDVKRSFKIASGAECFYTYGRAVTWFLSVLAPLKISPSRFFEDFAEWCSINNYKIQGDWESLKANHKEIEKMQLDFLKFKYEEKHKSDFFIAVADIVKLNGAFARCFGENEDSVLELNYNADELLGAGAMNIASFVENSFMEKSRIKVFWNDGDCQWQYC